MILLPIQISLAHAAILDLCRASWAYLLRSCSIGYSRTEQERRVVNLEFHQIPDTWGRNRRLDVT